MRQNQTIHNQKGADHICALYVPAVGVVLPVSSQIPWVGMRNLLSGI